MPNGTVLTPMGVGTGSWRHNLVGGTRICLDLSEKYHIWLICLIFCNFFTLRPHGIAFSYVILYNLMYQVYKIMNEKFNSRIQGLPSEISELIREIDELRGQ